MLQRRTFLAVSASALTAGLLDGAARAADAAAHSLAAIETRTGGRLGVCARDVASGRNIAYRADERFPMCSTFKVLLVGAVLRRVDDGKESLGRRIAFGPADLQTYAPVTRANVAAGSLTVAQLCSAAVVMSDNTAANLLLRTIGGPSGLTAFLRARPFGDLITRLDRDEPALNTALPGDPRDTTTPSRMVDALAVLLTTGKVLSGTSSRALETWMRRCETGTTALRAGAPRGWLAGDKTGSGANGTRNDVAIFRWGGHAPVIVAAYLTGARGIDDAARNAALANVGRIVTAALR